jgi:hypothetical protein
VLRISQVSRQTCLEASNLTILDGEIAKIISAERERQISDVVTARDDWDSRNDLGGRSADGQNPTWSPQDTSVG